MMVLSEPDDIITMGSGHPDVITQLEDGNANVSLPPLNVHNNSVWSLTLNEIKLKSGKSFGSMNMDEILANLWSNTDDHHHAGQVVAQPNQPNNDLTNKPFDDDHRSSLSLERHQSSSLISIPSPLCKKTVDEIWYEIQRDQCSTHHLEPTIDDVLPHERQHSLGEMTFEEFLVQAGVIKEARHARPPPSTNTTTTSSSTSTLQQQLNLETPLLGSFDHGGFASYQMTNNPSEVYVGEASSHDHDVQMEFGNEQVIKGKIIDGPPEVLVERRQRRMIKNRESAARSRARKQAYTMELQLELNYLREENIRLKQNALDIEQKTKEKIMRMTEEAILRQNKKPDKLRSLRRTASI